MRFYGSRSPGNMAQALRGLSSRATSPNQEDVVGGGQGTAMAPQAMGRGGWDPAAMQAAQQSSMNALNQRMASVPPAGDPRWQQAFADQAARNGPQSPEFQAGVARAFGGGGQPQGGQPPSYLMNPYTSNYSGPQVQAPASGGMGMGAAMGAPRQQSGGMGAGLGRASSGSSGGKKGR